MKIIATIVLFFVATLAEPPVENRYLPPQPRLGFGGPSQIYGAPNSGYDGQHTDTVFGFRSSSPPFNQGSNFRRPFTQYGPPATRYNGPSQLYGAPSSSQMNGNRQINIPSSTYGLPASPSQQYLPAFGNGNDIGSRQSGTHEIAQSRQYLPPGGGNAYDNGSNEEPANYNFEYSVLDEISSNDFGHRESRLGDRAEGQYYVLLPDGRKQIVEYEADQNGYKPRISYQDIGLVNNGYGGNQNSDSSQGPY